RPQPPWTDSRRSPGRPLHAAPDRRRRQTFTDQRRPDDPAPLALPPQHRRSAQPLRREIDERANLRRRAPPLGMHQMDRQRLGLPLLEHRPQRPGLEIRPDLIRQRLAEAPAAPRDLDRGGHGADAELQLDLRRLLAARSDALDSAWWQL